MWREIGPILAKNWIDVHIPQKGNISLNIIIIISWLLISWLLIHNCCRSGCLKLTVALWLSMEWNTCEHSPTYATAAFLRPPWRTHVRQPVEAIMLANYIHHTQDTVLDFGLYTQSLKNCTLNCILTTGFCCLDQICSLYKQNSQ